MLVIDMAGLGLKNKLEMLLTASRHVRHLSLLILLVGLHSISLGIFIYFFTELFYRFFFHTGVENIFFVRQAGLFLFCLGLFYLSLLTDLKRMHRLAMVVISTKVLAVIFLVTNAHFTVCPTMIYLSAAGDGCMAFLLGLFYRKALPCLSKSVLDR